MTQIQGRTLTLTTPMPRDEDAVFPGENWFFYWKTSASLWRSKLEDLGSCRQLMVPLNWSFHTDTGDQFDFGAHRPETDLVRLWSIATEVGVPLVFLFPLTPMPYLANGGVPHLLARHMMQDSLGVNRVIVDGEGRFHSMYSFYDPRIFTAYGRFAAKVARLFSEKGVNSDVLGLRAGHLVYGRFQSFLDDYSPTFDKAFSRFLEAKRAERMQAGMSAGAGVATDVFTPGPLIKDETTERAYKVEFRQTIEELYLKAARENLSANWEGTINVNFLGASPANFFEKVVDVHSAKKYGRELTTCIVREILPSSVLLPSRVKKGVLHRQLDDLVVHSQLPYLVDESYYEGDRAPYFAPLKIFYAYSTITHPEDGADPLIKTGFVPYVQSEFGDTFAMRPLSKLNLEEATEVDGSIHIVTGRDIPARSFSEALRIFMNGGRVILDQSSLGPELARRLEAFLVENSLETEKIHFVTPITQTRLGEGRLVLFNGQTLSEEAPKAQHSFWQRLIATFNFHHLPLEADESILWFWRTRPSTHHELSYEEVRRLSVYNPSSYKKKVKLSLRQNFALIKVVDEFNSSLKTQPHEVEIELMPEGSVSLDFGVFSS